MYENNWKRLKINGIIPAVIGAAAILGGAAMAKRSQDKARASANKNADANMRMQREFAQQGVRWKVEDAKAAGLHPLAALGSQTNAYTPQAMPVFDDSPMGRGISQAGQNISRAVATQKTAEEKEFTALKLQRARLENKLGEVEYVKALRDLYPPSATNMPSSNVNSVGVLEQDINTSQDGQYVNYVAKDIIPGSKMGQQTGARHQNQIFHDENGYAIITPSKEATEPMENDFVEKIRYAGRKVWGIAQANWYHKHNMGKGYNKFISKARRFRPIARPGYEYRLARNGLFQLHKKAHPRDSRFWATPITVFRNGRQYKTWTKN